MGWDRGKAGSGTGIGLPATPRGSGAEAVACAFVPRGARLVARAGVAVAEPLGPYSLLKPAER